MHYLLLLLSDLLDDLLLPLASAAERVLELAVLLAELPGLLLLHGLAELLELGHQTLPLLWGQVLLRVKLLLEVCSLLLVVLSHTILSLLDVRNKLLYLCFFILTNKLELFSVSLNFLVQRVIFLVFF